MFNTILLPLDLTDKHQGAMDIAAAMARLRADKLREARAGHDGTWIVHPGLAALAREAFDAVMTGPNQLAVKRAEDRKSTL